MDEEQSWCSQEATSPSKAPAVLSAVLLEQARHCLADLPWSHFQKHKVRGRRGGGVGVCGWGDAFPGPQALHCFVHRCVDFGSAESCPATQLTLSLRHPGHPAGRSVGTCPAAHTQPTLPALIGLALTYIQGSPPAHMWPKSQAQNTQLIFIQHIHFSASGFYRLPGQETPAK